MQPMITPQSLGQLNQVPIDMTLEGMDWLRRGQQADKAGLADLMGGYQQNEAMRPMLQEQQRISNDTSLAQLPGVRAQSEMLQRKNTGEGMLFQPEMQAKIRKLATEASEDDLKQIEIQGQKLMYSQNPNDRKRGEQILGASKLMFAERQKHEMTKALEAQKAAEAQKLMQMQIDAGRFEKAPPRGGKSPEQILASMGYEKASVYHEALADAAEEAGDMEKAMRLRDQASKYKQAYERAKILQALAAQGGKVDIGATAGVPTVAAPQTQGFTPPAAPAASDRVRVVSPDGKVGTIPRSQLKDALGSGYKEQK